LIAGKTRSAAAPGATHGTRPLPPVSRFRRYRPMLQGASAVAIFLLVWHAVASARIMNPLFLPGPVDIFEAEIELFSADTIWNDLLVSGREFAVGYTLAAATAIPLGLLMGWYRGVRYSLDPFISFLYATPRVVLLPLFIIWFGIGEQSKMVLVFLGAFFSIVIATAAGVRSLDQNLLKVARSFNATDRHIFWTIALPGTIPFILTGLRLGIGHALIAVVVGEFVAARAGIGLRIAIAGATFQTAKVFAGVIIVASTGILITTVLTRLEARFDQWRPRSRTS
jgi:ABC-type nitrate/sulfonate/bicarbonate transport system permease component